MSDKTIKMYAHNACPMVPSVIALLKGANADYEYINIHQDIEAREYVREVNNGFESVPTLLFPDGSTLTEPSTGELKTKLNAIGYDVPLPSMIVANVPKLIFAAVIVWAVMRFIGVL